VVEVAFEEAMDALNSGGYHIAVVTILVDPSSDNLVLMRIKPICYHVANLISVFGEESVFECVDAGLVFAFGRGVEDLLPVLYEFIPIVGINIGLLSFSRRIDVCRTENHFAISLDVLVCMPYA
jgi:hypothetical protein